MGLVLLAPEMRRLANVLGFHWIQERPFNG
jgi:hypothetical protein